MWTCVFLKYDWWRVMWLQSATDWFVIIDILGGATRIGSSTKLGHPTRGTCKWFTSFSCIMLIFWNDLVMDDMLFSYRWMLNRLWNVDWFVDEC